MFAQSVAPLPQRVDDGVGYAFAGGCRKLPGKIFGLLVRYLYRHLQSIYGVNVRVNRALRRQNSKPEKFSRGVGCMTSR